MSHLQLTHGDFQLGVLPHLGGAISYFKVGTFDVLRPWDESQNVRKSGCYPLVPYSNRIAYGQFSSPIGQHQVTLNFGDHPHSLHGVAWQRAWQVVESHETECLLRLTHTAEGAAAADWPFSFEVEQKISLDDKGVSLVLSLRNDSPHSMPTGLGWHPYFPRHSGVELSFDAEAVWLNDSNALPCERALIPEKWQFKIARELGYVGLDNCFEGWPQQAQVAWPKAGIRVNLSAENLSYLVVFTPPEPQDFIAVEPVSHLNNAVNMSEPTSNGMVWLASGATMVRTMRLDIDRE
jgi:aldose 1-epimerase